MKRIPLLKVTDIEVKVKQVTAKGAVLLLYKTARTDMNILDEVFGAENWTDDYKEIAGVLYCGIGARTEDSKPFVWKWSNGIESRADEEGNQVKGEASDAFKRAGFMWGIGRELYSAPFIFVSVETEQNGKIYKLKNKFAKFTCAEIEYNEDRTIKRVVIKDDKGNVLFGKLNGKKREVREDDYNTTPAPIEPPVPSETIDEDVIGDILYCADVVGQSEENVLKWVQKKFGKASIEDLTLEEANALIRVLKARKEGSKNA